MKTISVSVSGNEYASFQQAAKSQNRSVASLIRDAMAFYRAERLDKRAPLKNIPVLTGHRPLGELPKRAEIYEEISDRGDRNR